MFRMINQKISNPSEAEKAYFDRYGLPDCVERQKKNVSKKGTNYDAHLDAEEAKVQFDNGKLLEGNIRFNEFNQRIAFVTVEGVKTDIIITSENDQNRALDRDLVMLRLINPKFWDLLKENATGADNDKPIEKRVIDEGKQGPVVGDGIEIVPTKEDEKQTQEEAKEVKLSKIAKNLGDDDEVIDDEEDDDGWITQEEDGEEVDELSVNKDEASDQSNDD